MNQGEGKGKYIILETSKLTRGLLKKESQPSTFSAPSSLTAPIDNQTPIGGPNTLAHDTSSILAGCQFGTISPDSSGLQDVGYIQPLFSQLSFMPILGKSKMRQGDVLTKQIQGYSPQSFMSLVIYVLRFSYSYLGISLPSKRLD